MDMEVGIGSPTSPVMPAGGLENSIISKSSRQSSVQQSFMKELDKINELQAVVTNKLTKEKRREEKLKEDIQVK